MCFAQVQTIRAEPTIAHATHTHIRTGIYEARSMEAIKITRNEINFSLKKIWAPLTTQFTNILYIRFDILIGFWLRCYVCFESSCTFTIIVECVHVKVFLNYF